MIDCSNGDIRDQLPELVNGRLVGDPLAAVRAHLVDCALCQAEVELLERTRAILIFTTPRIDATRIAQALPTPSMRSHSHSRAFDWRIAATIAVLAVGGGGTALMHRNRVSPKLTDTITIATNAQSITDGSELSISSDLSGLSDEQLDALVSSVNHIEALPSAEVHSASPVGDVTEPPGDSSGAW